MSVSSIYERVIAQGDGNQTTFSFPYKFISESDIIVYKNDILQIIDTNYTLLYPITKSTCQVVFNTAPSVGDDIVIKISVNKQQAREFKNQSSFNANEVEKSYDKLTLLVQEIMEEFASKAIIIPSQSEIGWSYDNLTEDQRLLFVDTVNKKIKETSFVVDDVVTAIGGMLLRQRIDGTSVYFEYSVDSGVTWVSLDIIGIVDLTDRMTADEANIAALQSDVSDIEVHQAVQDGLIANKADTTYVDNQLAVKANTIDVVNALSMKADTTYVDNQLANKADQAITYTKTEVDTSLALKQPKTYTATCSTAIGTAGKTMTTDQTLTSLIKGDQLLVTYTNGNSAFIVTLNVNGLGVKATKLGGSDAALAHMVSANASVLYIYDGTSWVLSGQQANRYVPIPDLANQLTSGESFKYAANSLGGSLICNAMYGFVDDVYIDKITATSNTTSAGSRTFTLNALRLDKALLMASADLSSGLAPGGYTLQIDVFFQLNRLSISADNWKYAVGEYYDLSGVLQQNTVTTDITSGVPLYVGGTLQSDGYTFIPSEFSLTCRDITKVYKKIGNFIFTSFVVNQDQPVYKYDTDTTTWKLYTPGSGSGATGLELGETSTTAYRGDRGKTAYDHSQTTGNPHGTTKTDLGLGNVDNTSDADKPISTATSTALGNKVDKVTGKGLSTNDLTDVLKTGYDVAANVPSLTREPTGFLSPESVIVTYDAATQKITLTGTTTAYYRGTLVSALTSGWVSAAHTNSVGTYFLYYDGANFIWGTSFPDFSVLQIAVVNYRATNSFANRECHGFMPWQCHLTDHLNIGTYRSAGGDITNLILSSTTVDNRRPIISACTINDEDNPTVNAALTSKKYSQRFMSSASDINITLQANDIVSLSGNNPYYNSFDGTNFNQTLMPANSMMTVWLYEVPVTADAASQELRHVFIQGQSITQATNSSANALTTAYNTELAKSTSELNLGVPNIVSAEYVAIQKFIIEFTGGNWSIRGSIKLTGSKANQTGSPSGNFLTSVTTDSTLTGNGTALNPLSVVDTNFVHKTGDETIAGVKTFSSFPVTPSSAPTTDYQVANRKFVLDNAGGSAILPTGTCSTAGATTAKEVTVADYTEVTGVCSLITFSNKNTTLGPNLYIPFTGGTADDPVGVYTLTTTGSPTYTGDKFNSNGNSGISYNIASLGTGSWCIQVKVKSTNTSTAQEILGSVVRYGFTVVKQTDNKLRLYVSSNNSSWNISNGTSGSKNDWGTSTEYYLRVRFSGTHYYIDWSADGSSWTNDIDVTSSTVVNSAISGVRFALSYDFVTPLIGTMDDIYVTIGSATTITDYPTLNINSSGAKYLCHEDGTRVNPANPAYFIANCPIQFCYDGTGYRFKRSMVRVYSIGVDRYKLYNDGWIEQGGHVSADGTVTLIKPMLSTNYSILFGSAPLGGGEPPNSGVPRCNVKTTTTFTYGSATVTNTNADWRIEGYAA